MKLETAKIDARKILKLLPLLLVTCSVTATTAVSYEGDLDPSFGSEGRVLTSFPGYAPYFLNDHARALAVQPDGKIVAAGNAVAGFIPFTELWSDFAVARYNADGRLDRSFGNRGQVVTEVSNSIDAASSVAIQPDGKIVAAGGAVDTLDDMDFALARYDRNGALDRTFGFNGTVVTPFPGTDAIRDIQLQPDGKLVAAGWAETDRDAYTFVIARYQANGALDITFGDQGKVYTPLESHVFSSPGGALEIQPDGKIVGAASSSNAGAREDFSLVRYNSNGTPDTSFGAGGRVTTALSNENDWIEDVALQRDGKILVAGSADFPAIGDPRSSAFARYSANGQLDSSFGKRGTFVVRVAPYDTVRELAIQRDGKIVAAGYKSEPDFDYDFAVTRLNENGTLDTDFGSRLDADFGPKGTVTTSFDSSADSAYSVVLQQNGKIVVAGEAKPRTNDSDFALARYEAERYSTD